jgi:hypothetical protein
LSPEGQQQFLTSLDLQETAALEKFWQVFAHEHQSPPEGLWSIWLLLGGRGAGKTRTGAEWVRELAQGSGPEAKKISPIALVGETDHDVREVMIEGVSGILAAHLRSDRPTWIPSRRRLEWPSGVVAQAFSAEDPDSLRGPQFAAAWCDELAKWRYLDTNTAGLLKPVLSGGGSSSSANPAQTNGGFDTYTWIERGVALTNGNIVVSLGFYSTASGSVTLKIVKRNSAGNYDVVVSETFSHGGSGWQSFNLSSAYAIPGSGTYYPAIYTTISGAVLPYSNGISRAYKSGDVTGTGQSGISEDSGAMLPLRATYQGTTSNMTAKSTALTAAAAPSSMKVVARTKHVDSITLNTDYKISVSRDGGTTWSYASLTDRFTVNSIHVLEADSIDVSSQPSGTSVKWRIETLNNKMVETHDLYQYWS